MNKEFYTQNFKQALAERETPVDTTCIQLNSLQLFMEELGYICNITDNTKIKGMSGFKITSWANNLANVTLPKFISFQDAIRLHNGVYHRRVGKDFIDVMSFTYPMIIPCGIYDSAVDSKLVAQVKLQKLKKAPYVKVQNHYVQLLED